MLSKKEIHSPPIKNLITNQRSLLLNIMPVNQSKKTQSLSVDLCPESCITFRVFLMTKFSKEYKLQAVKKTIKYDLSANQVAHEYG